MTSHEKDINRGFSAISQSLKQNIDMNIYIKMIISKLRFALMLRYAPYTENYIKGLVKESDLLYLKDLIKDKPEYITSQTLSLLLNAYQEVRNAVISSLPLEITLIKIFNAEK